MTRRFVHELQYIDEVENIQLGILPVIEGQTAYILPSQTEL